MEKSKYYIDLLNLEKNIEFGNRDLLEGWKSVHSTQNGTPKQCGTVQYLKIWSQKPS